MIEKIKGEMKIEEIMKTNREQWKLDTINSVQSLKNQGFSQVEAAKKLNKGIATIKRYWNV